MFFHHKNKKRTKKKTSEESPFVTKLGEVKYNKLEESSYRSEWTENTYLSNMQEREMVGKTFDSSRLKFIASVLVLMLAAIVLRAGWLQVAKGEYYSNMAEGNRIRVKEVPSKRGVIYDRNHTPLVRNIANFILYLVPADLPKEGEGREEIINEIAEILSSKKDSKEKTALAREMEEKIKKKKEEGWSQLYEPLFITDKISHEKAMLLYLRSQEWGGVVLTNKSRRQYLLETEIPKETENGEQVEPAQITVNSLSHVLGYAGKINKEELEFQANNYSPLDYIGKAGIEKYWEEELRGEKGSKKVEVDALGKEKRIISETASQDGHNLFLSVDLKLQGKIESILNDHLSKLDTSNAVVVAMDPDNGEVLSLVSVPSYDNNKFARGISSEEYQELISSSENPLFNKAINSNYPPGSTFKPVVAAAALEEGVITERTSFDSKGGIRIGQWFFPDWRAGGHGITDVRKAIAQSVNTFFYYIGGGHNDFDGLGVTKIIDYARKFGLGVETGIDLPSEAKGFLPSKEWKREAYDEQWYIGDTYHLSIGQGFLLLTPLQIANYTSAFANGGTLYRPRLAKEVEDTDGNVVNRIDSDMIRDDFVDDYNIQVVREGMRQAVVSGSSRRLLSLDVEAAGKTGTAQWSSKGEPHAWFTGFAPYDEPEIALTVLVEEGGDSDQVAVPIAEDILEYYFDRESEKEVE